MPKILITDNLSQRSLAYSNGIGEYTHTDTAHESNYVKWLILGQHFHNDCRVHFETVEEAHSMVTIAEQVSQGNHHQPNKHDSQQTCDDQNIVEIVCSEGLCFTIVASIGDLVQEVIRV